MPTYIWLFELVVWSSSGYLQLSSTVLVPAYVQWNNVLERARVPLFPKGRCGPVHGCGLCCRRSQKRVLKKAKVDCWTYLWGRRGNYNYGKQLQICYFRKIQYCSRQMVQHNKYRRDKPTIRVQVRVEKTPPT